jgi:hypothetical protein
MQKNVMRYPVEEAAAKHERIVKEASRLFRERGFENVSVGEEMKAAWCLLCPLRFEGSTRGGCRCLWAKSFARARAAQQQ